MSTPDYPVDCVTGHSKPVTLRDDAALVSHHTSEHSKVPIADYRNQFVKGKAPATGSGPSKAVKQKTPSTAVSRYGLTSTKLHEVQARDVQKGGLMTEEHTNDFLAFLGQQFSVSIDPAHFFIDLFILFLEHGGTNDVAGLGGTYLHDTQGSDRKFVTWQLIKELAISFFKEFNIDFSYRRWQLSMDDLLWEMWNDPEIRSLDHVRDHGTPRSTQFCFPDGTPVPAYVVVPDMFNAHLAANERGVRKAYNASANLTKEGQDTLDYVGVNNAGSVDDQVMSDSAKRAQIKMDKLWVSAGGKPGVGHPKLDPHLGLPAPRPSPYQGS
jgi:hypothetical protein